MAMSWPGYGGYSVPLQDEDLEDDEDFYGSEQQQNHTNGNDHMQTAAGASAHEMVGFLQPLAELTDLNIYHSLPRTHRRHLVTCNQITTHP